MNRDLRIVGPVHEPQSFNEWDDDLMSDICGPLAKPVQGLLITLSQIKTTQDSFGLNAELALKALLPDLRKLREVCLEEFNDA